MDKLEKMILLEQIEELIHNHPFEHFFLYNNLLKTLNNNYEINAKWLKGDQQSWILGFCSNNNYQIYGLNYTHEMLDEVTDELDLSLLPERLVISGNKKIWEYILSSNKFVNFTILKNRYFYEVVPETFNVYNNDTFTIRNGTYNDIDTLARLHCDFFKEEYKGQNNKELSDMIFSCTRLIADQEILVAEIEGTIVGYCTIMKTEFENEMIGTVFIVNEYRKKNIGKCLLSKVTSIILSRNPRTWLMTDMTNYPSNKLVSSLGYYVLSEYTSGEINKL